MENNKGLIRFVEMSVLHYGCTYNLYDVVYKDDHTPVTIHCPYHGEVRVTPEEYFKGPFGCPVCNSMKDMTKEEFIKRAKSIRGNGYDYEHIEWHGIKEPIWIKCKKHKITFFVHPLDFLYRSECPKCKHSEEHKAAKLKKEIDEI